MGLFAEGAEVDSLHAAGEADVLEELGVGGFGERGAVLSEETEGGLGVCAHVGAALEEAFGEALWYIC